jgi:hypothetical protein
MGEAGSSAGVNEMEKQRRLQMRERAARRSVTLASEASGAGWGDYEGSLAGLVGLFYGKPSLSFSIYREAFLYGFKSGFFYGLLCWSSWALGFWWPTSNEGRKKGREYVNDRLKDCSNGLFLSNKIQ